MDSRDLRAESALLLGPWTAYGTTVYAGSTVVCETRGPKGPMLARSIARLPELLEEFAEKAEKLEELEAGRDCPLDTCPTTC